MTTTDTVPTAADVTRRVRAIAARLPDRATEIEAARRLPADILSDPTTAGRFRLLRPGSHGGSEATFVEALSVYEMLATADPATGWAALIGATGWGGLRRLPPPTL